MKVFGFTNLNEYIMYDPKEIKRISKELQDEYHKRVNDILQEMPNATAQDAKNEFFFEKMALLYLMIKKVADETNKIIDHIN